MATTSDFSKTSEQILLDLVNQQNGTNFPASAMTVVKKEDLPAGRSTATVIANTGSGYRGSEVINYAQVDLAAAAPVFIAKSVAVEHGLLSDNKLITAINAAMNLRLKDVDIVVVEGSSTIPAPSVNGFVSFTRIRATNESLIWDGEMTVEVQGFTSEGKQWIVVAMTSAPAGFGVLAGASTGGGENGSVMLSEDGKVIVAG